MDGFDIGRLGYLILLLGLVGGWLFVEYRGRLGAALRPIVAWGLIILAVAAGYGVWTDMGPSLSPRQQMSGDAVELPRAPDGHYYLTLSVDGTNLRFLVDTGASGIVLSADDARRIGFDPGALSYLGVASTANGEVRTARVVLDRVDLGTITDRDVPAFVNEGELGTSLLGMSYLNRFHLEIAGDRMILRR
ncbi:retropepsin-like aspartic protease family protein [Falsirhodobacter halotolerans]|uniref:retropepsin-like aspartic protease family protein n=1 Tax=Falsirhodobacter halotolerans TaxID=1146892 RepID=UPI001FD43D71|nr:TIGR02281 family clan AA aspartic protease [Falsirhodobacter halotolerans]MCJ8139759.1 TIGR02281 family clan AA aspartic protease [Falsirhodobacter halotolerans]